MTKQLFPGGDRLLDQANETVCERRRDRTRPRANETKKQSQQFSIGSKDGDKGLIRARVE